MHGLLILTKNSRDHVFSGKTEKPGDPAGRHGLDDVPVFIGGVTVMVIVGVVLMVVPKFVRL